MRLAAHAGFSGVSVAGPGFINMRLTPGWLADAAAELAQRFSRFYAECPVLGAERAGQRDARLAICHLAGVLLVRSLDLLGIDVPERM